MATFTSCLQAPPSHGLCHPITPNMGPSPVLSHHPGLLCSITAYSQRVCAKQMWAWGRSSHIALRIGIEELLLLGLILPSLVTSSRCPTEPQISTYPVGLNHASPGVELHCFQPCSLLLFHPGQKERVASPMHVPSTLPTWLLRQLQAPSGGGPIGKGQLLPREGQMWSCLPRVWPGPVSAGAGEEPSQPSQQGQRTDSRLALQT